MKTFLASKLLILLFLLVQILHAELEFDHKDWQVVCDNTHTCRMAGYTLMTLDDKHIPLSMMFVRQAGADQGFDGFIKIGLWDGQKEIPENKVTISVGGQRYTTSKDAKMSEKLTKALLQALIKDQKILVNLGKNITWKMSQSGTFAVMLKMDEYQKRIGTKGALFKKGNKNENEVLEQKVLPTIAAPSWPLSQNFPQEVTLEDDVKKKIGKKLADYYGDDKACWIDSSRADETFQAFKLSSKYVLVTQLCWSGAYNFVEASWVVTKTEDPKVNYIGTVGNAIQDKDGTIHLESSTKSRGLGDCWRYERSVWDGESFVTFSKGTTGLCRGFVGGAWDLPTLKGVVKPQKFE